MSIISEKKKINKHTDESILDERNLLEKKATKKEKKPTVINSFADVFPIKDYGDHDFFEMENDEYLEIVQVTSKDVYSLNEDDKDNDIFSLAYMLQSYLDDIKIVPLYTPVNLEKQKDKIIKRIRNCKVDYYLPFLEKKLYELEFIEEHRTNKEYFIFLYADTTKDLLEKKEHLKKLLIQSNAMIELDLKKKMNVLFQMSNLNTKPLTN